MQWPAAAAPPDSTESALFVRGERFRDEKLAASREFLLRRLQDAGYAEASMTASVRPDRAAGYPSLKTMAGMDLDFFVGTGDNVYYDTPYLGRAKTRGCMRARWHRQFAKPRFARFFQRVPVYWEKDDHDYRYNDADPHGEIEPSPELGAAVFREQVPVVPPGDPEAVTYRTHRINGLLQIWLLEGRDYRDSNIDPPGPDKTMWGASQRKWLQETLLASDAVFKILISPTPIVTSSRSRRPKTARLACSCSPGVANSSIRSRGAPSTGWDRRPRSR